jgi:hypothetical protein
MSSGECPIGGVSFAPKGGLCSVEAVRRRCDVFCCPSDT